MNLIWAYIVEHPEQTFAALVIIAEAVTRMIKTKNDAGFITRLGNAIDFVLSRMPNRIK